MKPKSTLRRFLSITSSALLTSSYSHAATLYWDGATPAGPPGGGAGTWQTAGNWDTSPNTDSSSNWTDGNTAYFGGTAGTVTIDTGGVTVGGLTFSTTAYTLAAGTNGLNFGSGTNTILLKNVATATITGTVGGTGNVVLTRNTNGGTLTLSTASGNGWSGTTTVNSGMTLSLANTSNALINSTGISINGGTLTVNKSGVQTEQVSDTADITFNGGGTYQQTNGSSGPFAETLDAVTVASGQANFNYTNGASSGGVVTTLTSLSRSVTTAAVTFSNANAAQTSFVVSGAGTTAGWTSGATSNSIIGPWATTGTAVATQTDYAVYNAGTVTAANTAADAETNWSDSTKAYTLSIPAKTASALTATRNVAALKESSTATNLSSATVSGSPNFVVNAHAFTVGDPVVLGGTAPTNFSTGIVYYVQSVVDANTITLAATPGAITPINAGSAKTPNITGGLKLDAGINLGTTGILNAGGAAFGIGRTAAGGSVTLPTAGAGSLFVNAGSGTISIEAPIVDYDGSSALTLAKNGSGNLFLTGANTFTGGLVNNAGGTTTLSGANTFGSGAVTINGGAVTFSTVASWGGTGRNVTFNGGGSLTSTADGYTTGGTLTVNAGAYATVSGGNTAFTTTTGSGTLVLNTNPQNKIWNLGNASGFTGTLQARMGVNSTSPNGGLQFSSLGDAAGSALQFVNAQGGNNDSGLDLAVFLAGDAGPLTFDNRQVQILDRINGNWEINENILANNNATAANKWVINTDLLYLGGRENTVAQTNRFLTLSGSNTGDNAFNGKISDGVVAGVAFNVQKSGNGKWILSGANTYTGTTKVSGGTLVGIGANAFGSTSGISTTNTPTLSLRGDTSTSFIKASDSTPYSLTTSTTGVTLNVDQATIAGTGAKTMTFGDITTSSVAATYQFNFTGANNTSLSAGTLNTAVSTSAAVHTINNNISGGGSLTLASIFNRATTVASPNLVFTGTGTTIITGAITQTLVDMDLIKNGDGTLLLNGTNTYTGLTSVNDGTLGGTGTIAGDVTVAAAGSLAPGASAGTLSIGGGLDISAQVDGGAGKLKFQLGANTAASDQLAVTGTLTTGGKLGFSDFDFTYLAGGPQNGTYVLITTPADPTALLDGADLSGTIGVGGTGTLDVSGNNIVLNVTGLGGGSPFDTWAGTGTLGPVTFGGDTNGDGVQDGLAFLLGAANPDDIALGLLPTVTETAGGLVLTFDMLDAASRGTAALSVEHSSDLGIGDPWEAALVPDVDNTVNDVVFDITAGTPLNVQATIPASKAAGAKLFGRLKATE